MSARDLSQALGVREKEVYAHLPHVARSVQKDGMQLLISPVACLACGYRFKNRKRYTRPGRCPQCKATRIQTPLFIIQ
jgi:predicted Zn-ribbon and HTH transcriptional regulator